MPKSSGHFKAVWNCIQLTLTEKEYDIVMSHVELMRQRAADKSYYECSDDCNEDLPDPDEPEAWRLSDTLNDLFKDAKAEKKWKGLPDADLIKKGLRFKEAFWGFEGH